MPSLLLLTFDNLLQIKAKKASWTMGSSFLVKKGN
ncbi:unnamed protein product [Musa acuminata subsp. malaccensis]|uniref:(wild Malaysian banana) hypothetical protein n=1 Tax=Musa acuminata subsp. malaccensis TaxID=214687 RepID=A0A8D6ZZ73_MUSAM|nr:unnamed protein product [Musa acuminata subsp. malaccensis]